MPSRSKHEAAAALNEKLAESLIDDTQTCPWAAALAFYSALHCVDAYLASLNTPVHPANHKERLRHIRQTNLRAIYDN
jgi:hypothetical protein